MKPYGCNNSERQPGYLVPVRVQVGGTLVYASQYIKDTSTTDCRYDQRGTDQRCVGCGK